MLKKYFEYLAEINGSDIHLKAGSFPIVRINGELQRIENSTIVTDEEINQIENFLINKIVN